MLDGIPTEPGAIPGPPIKRLPASAGGGVSAACDGEAFRARVAEAAVAAPRNLRRDIDIVVSSFG
jgi:hypothetical protein